MPTFDQFLDAYTASFDPSTFDPEQFKTAFLRAHADEVSLRDAKIASVESQLTSTSAELLERKADLYDQLMNSGPPVSSIPVTNPTGAPVDNPDDVDISAMFLTK